MIKASQVIHKKSDKQFIALCGTASFYSTEIGWKVTCEKCRKILLGDNKVK